MAKVNLDALIQREDFEIRDPDKNVGTVKDTLSINDLKREEFFFSALRKPDFQRETNEWETTKICDFIESYLDGDLIPAVILWKSASSDIFVIDGSHRLSALAAWINDDYGDGDISKSFYDGIIPDEQREIAQRTRNAMHRRIGSFADHIFAVQYPKKARPMVVERAKRLGSLAIQLQWVHGDSSKAESSFFKINQQASPINSTELRVLKARKMPSGIAARAIIRSGKGHKYWSAFPEENQSTIESLADEINTLLFHPELDNPIKTLDLPVGGKLYAAQSLPLVLDFVKIVNGDTAEDTTNGSIDEDGSATIKYLMNCRRIARIISSSHPSSLGLHPIVYFYAASGRHKIASFFAVTALILHFERHRYFAKFIKVRAGFENMLINHDYLIQQIVRKYRSAQASYPHIRDFYIAATKLLEEGKNAEDAVAELMKSQEFNYLAYQNEQRTFEEEITGDFSRETKSEAFIREALSACLRCKICGGYIHRNSISIDHINPKRDGGIASVENAQLTHPYCNTGIKN